MRQILISKEEISSIVKKLGDKLTTLLKNEPNPPIFVAILKGSLPFFIDLIREVKIPLKMDFMQVSSYVGTESTGVVKLKKDVSENISNRVVVVVEDIIDSGYTIKWVKEYLCSSYSPKKVYITTLVDKKCKRKVDISADFVGKEIDDYFIAGYGLDYNEYFRNEEEIFIPSKEELDFIDKLNDDELKI